MTRLVTFLGALLALSLVMTLLQYKSLPVNNERFDFEATSQAYLDKIEEKKELEQMRLERLNPVVEEESTVTAAPLVDLNTPQLQNGFDLYQRCIVCHGRNGEGRSSQNAPAVGGQHEWYILSSLKDMKEGRRVNALMNPYLRNLENKDFEDLAAYLSKLPWMGAAK